VEATRLVPDVALAPLRVCVDAYEVAIGLATDFQLAVARSARIELVRSLAGTSANLTRDIGAAQLSTVRWFLDA
jgi:hypothetical protein